jgi:hypothetical protein
MSGTLCDRKDSHPLRKEGIAGQILKDPKKQIAEAVPSHIRAGPGSEGDETDFKEQNRARAG